MQIRIVFLDPTLDSQSDSNEKYRKALVEIEPDARFFTKADELDQFFKKEPSNKVFLVTSGTIGQEIIPRIHEIENLQLVCLFCQNVEKHEKWAGRYRKIQLVSTNFTQIKQLLSVEMQHSGIISIPFNIIQENSSFDALLKDSPMFLFTRILLKSVTSMKHEDNEKDLFVRKIQATCAQKYKKDEIEEFARRLNMNESLRFYRRDSFIYDYLNRSLMRNEVEVIVELGFYIHAAQQRLEYLRTHGESNDTPPTECFYGTAIKEAQMRLLESSTGSMITFNSFLIVDGAKDKALELSKAAADNSNLLPVLFTIRPAKNIEANLFIPNTSSSRTDSTFMIHMQPIFLLEKKQTTEPNPCPTFVLTLFDPESEHVRKIVKPLDKQFGYEPWVRISSTLDLILKTELHTTTSDDISKLTKDQAELYSFQQLANIKKCRHRKHDALFHYENFFRRSSHTMPELDPKRTEILTQIANLYREIGRLGEARKRYEEIHKILVETMMPDHIKLAQSHENLGRISLIMGDRESARKEYENARFIYEKHASTQQEKLRELGKTIAQLK